MLPEALIQDSVVVAITSWDAGVIRAGKLDRGELTLDADPSKICELCRFLKQEQGFVRLVNITAVDRYPSQERFEVIYHLHSISANKRLRVKCRLGGESPSIESVTGVWRAANWYEREMYDLFGVRVDGHPDLKRLLLPEDWDGHPLRKDFPVHGYKYSYGDE